MPTGDNSYGAPTGARRARGALLLLVVGTIAFYAAGIGWGVPHATAPDRTKTFATDELLPLEPLAEMHSTFVVSKPDRNYAYPWWHYFVLATAQAPYLGYLKVTGGMDSPSPDYPFGLDDPVGSLEVLTVIGRAVSVLMAAGIVLAAYGFAATLWDRSTGLLAAGLTALNYLMVYYGRTGNLDVPAFFWTAIALWVFARVLAHGVTTRRMIGFGAFAALAIATKDQAVVVLLPLAIVLLLPAFRRTGLRPLLIGLGISVAVYAAATGMLVDPSRHATHVYRLFFAPDSMSTAHLYHTRLPATALAGEYVRALAATMSPVVLVAAIAGAWLVWRKAPRRLALLLPVLTLFAMLILPAGFAVRRYLLPLALPLDALAAHAAITLGRSRWRAASVALVILMCGARFLVAADLTHAQLTDTRGAASQWLAAEASPGDTVAYFGTSTKLPHLPAEIRSTRVGDREEWKGTSDAESQLRYLDERRPEFVVLIPDWTSRPGMQHSGDCPPEVWDALTAGYAGYAQAAMFEEGWRLPSWLGRPRLDNPSVSPPVRIFTRGGGAR